MAQIFMTPERIAGYLDPNKARLEKLLVLFNKHHLDLDFYLASDLLSLLIEENFSGYQEAAKAITGILDKQQVSKTTESILDLRPVEPKS